MLFPGIAGVTGSLASLASLAAFIRDRLGEVAPKAGSLFLRRDDAPALTDGPDPPATRIEVIVDAAAAPFAPSSYARARLLRQLHASGLLSDRETEQAERLLGVAQ